MKRCTCRTNVHQSQTRAGEIVSFTLRVRFRDQLIKWKNIYKMDEILQSEEEYLIKANEWLLDWNFLKAFRVLNELLEEEPCSGKAHALMGEIIYFIQNNPRQALIHFKLAITYTPDNFKPYVLFISIEKSMGEYKEVLKVIDKAYAIFFDKRDQLLCYKAEVYAQQRKWKRAKLYYKRALIYVVDDNFEQQINKAIQRLDKKLSKKKKKRKKAKTNATTD